MDHASLRSDTRWPAAVAYFPNLTGNFHRFRRLLWSAVADGSGSLAAVDDRPLPAYSVEKLVWRSGAGTAAKFDLIERPLLNATRSGDGL